MGSASTLPALAGTGTCDLAMTIAYPHTPTVDQIDEYHGSSVPDPYRWLEDENNPGRAMWIAAQNALTARYLSRIPVRDALHTRFLELLDYPRYYDFVRRGPLLFYKRNSGLQNQLTLYMANADGGVSEVLLDPCTIDPDGTTRVTSMAASANARYLAYGIARYGGDWEEYRIRDLAAKEDLADEVLWVKASGIAWRGDGFYYSRYPAPGDGSISAPNERHQVWYHRAGTAQTTDTLIYDDPDHCRRLYAAYISDNERFLLLSIRDRAAGFTGNALSIMDCADAKPTFQPIVEGFENAFFVVDWEDDALIAMTNCDAPNWRVVRIRLARPVQSAWEEVLPERPDRLELVAAAGSLCDA